MEVQEMFREVSKTEDGIDDGDGGGGGNSEDVTQLSNMREDDGVFRATMRTLLRRQSVENVDLDAVADERSGALQ